MHKKILFAFIILQFLLILILSVRFDRIDIGPVKEIASSNMEGKIFNDSQMYVKYVDYFRKSVVVQELSVPYVYRPAIPFLASFLPFRPMTSINLINVFLLSIGLWMLCVFLHTLRFGSNAIIVGGAMYVISFPIFYYGSVGYVDASIIAFFILGITAIYNQKWFYFACILFTGALVKESIIILLPVALAYLIFSRQKWKWKFLLFVIAFLLPSIIVRIIFSELGTHAWIPSTELLIDNLRLRAVLSNVLTLGIPGFISMFVFKYSKDILRIRGKEFYYPLLTGCVFCLLFIGYSFVSAYADGRPMWTSYIFTIPLSLTVLERSKFKLFHKTSS